MNQKITWDSVNKPDQMSLDMVLYEIRRADAGENLVLDAVTMADILSEADEIMALDALITPYAKLQRKMEVLQTVMERAGGDIKPVAMQLSDPFKQSGVAQVAAVFELSDGQTISIFFHNPDVTPAKITPTDELISWKWMLNKKDITIVVAPEKGQDLNLKVVASRIIKLAEKNSSAFQRANTKRAENLAAIESLKAEIPVLEKQLRRLEHDLEVAKIEEEQRTVRREASESLPEAVNPAKRYITVKNELIKLGWEVAADGMTLINQSGSFAVKHEAGAQELHYITAQRDWSIYKKTGENWRFATKIVDGSAGPMKPAVKVAWLIDAAAKN
jgi:hypothetical protein